MTWMWTLLALSLIAAVATIILTLLFGDPDGGWTIVGVMVGGLATLVGLIVSIVLLASFYVDRSRCAAWERETGRDSRFVIYNAVSWSCLTRSDDGKWIPNGQLREFGD